MTRFMKLFLSLAAVSCHCGLAQELQVSYTTELQSDFKQGSNWNVGSGLSLVLMVFILISMVITTKYDKNGEGGMF